MSPALGQNTRSRAPSSAAAVHEEMSDSAHLCAAYWHNAHSLTVIDVGGRVRRTHTYGALSVSEGVARLSQDTHELSVSCECHVNEVNVCKLSVSCVCSMCA